MDVGEIEVEVKHGWRNRASKGSKLRSTGVVGEKEPNFIKQFLYFLLAPVR